MQNINMDHRTKDLVTDATAVLMVQKESGGDVDKKTKRHEYRSGYKRHRQPLTTVIVME